MKSLFRLSAFAALAIAGVSCAELTPGDEMSLKSPKLPETPYDYASKAIVPFENSDILIGGGGPILIDPIPGFFPGSPQLTVTNEGATLGRVLFYDPRLSVSNTISCGSCHLPEKGFGDSSPKTTGFKGMKTVRNSMPIANLGLQKGFFWTNNNEPLKKQVLNPVRNHLEMGMEDISVLVEKLNQTDFYAPMFQKAFGTTEISEDRISDALAQFLFSMTSTTSKFDRVNNFNSSGQQMAQFTAEEALGNELFHSERLNCSSCHNVSSNLFAHMGDDPYGGSPVDPVAPNLQQGTNIGLDLFDSDRGNGAGGFKIPNLRNVALTAPYMHDGRFATLSEVLDHYSTGIKDNASLDSRLRAADGHPVRLNLTSTEKNALVAFLNTLTDQDFVQDPRFTDPFKD